MSFDTSTKIADYQGERFKSNTHLELMNDGAIKLGAIDYGPFVEECWGRDRDYEYWVDVPPTAVGKLAFELMKEKYAGDWEAVGKFRTWCQEHNVEHEWEVW